MPEDRTPGTMKTGPDQRSLIQGFRAGTARAAEWFWMHPDRDLRDDIKEAEESFGRSDLRADLSDTNTSARLDALVQVVQEVMKHESDRETNLNARGAAVASVAALIVAVSSAVGRPVLDADDWSGGMQQATVGLFLFALVVVAVAMVVVVVGVLRPKRGPTSEIFLAQTFIEEWMCGEVSSLLNGKGRWKDPRLLYVDRSLRTLSRWYYRNRIKARWLRRSYVLLASGVALIGLTGLFVLSHEAEFPLELSLFIVAAGVVLTWLAIELDLLGAVTERAMVRNSDGTGEKVEGNGPRQDERDDASRP